LIRRRLLALGSLAASVAACSPAGILNATVSDEGVMLTPNLAYGPGPRRTLDVYRPTAASGSGPLVIFIYGGAWRSGSKDMYAFVARPLARRGVVVVVPDYRLYPEVMFPDFLDDNASAVAWTFARAAEFGADPARIFLMGHSAGAFNIGMLALDPRWLANAGIDRDRLAGAIGLAGPYHFLPTDDKEAIPVFGPNNTPANEPYAFADGHNKPMFLAAGTDDTTVMPRNTTDLAARIRERGGPVTSTLYPGIGHIGLITAFAPLFQSRAPVLDDVSAFITRVGT
jgi:acetyl esterase/lipase